MKGRILIAHPQGSPSEFTQPLSFLKDNKQGEGNRVPTRISSTIPNQELIDGLRPEEVLRIAFGYSTAVRMFDPGKLFFGSVGKVRAANVYTNERRKNTRKPKENQIEKETENMNKITRAAMAIVAVLVATSITSAHGRSGNITAISISATNSTQITASINLGENAITPTSIVEESFVPSIGIAYQDIVNENMISQDINNARIDNHIGNGIIQACEAIGSSDRTVSSTAIVGVVNRTIAS